MKEITAATLADIPQLCQLLSILFSQELDFQADAIKQSAALQQIIRHPATGQILVLRQGGDIVGMVSLLFTISTACGGKAALLEDMIVHPERRNTGVGTMLLRAAIAVAISKNCLRITLLTDHTNEPALRFYQRHGFTQSKMTTLRLALAACRT